MSKKAEVKEECRIALPQPATPAPLWEVGKNYFIRTVSYHYTGKLKAVHPDALVIVDAAWVADSGRWTQAIATGSLNEVEPYPDGQEVIINRGSIVDASIISWPLPRQQK